MHLSFSRGRLHECRAVRGGLRGLSDGYAQGELSLDGKHRSCRDVCNREGAGADQAANYRCPGMYRYVIFIGGAFFSCMCVLLYVFCVFFFVCLYLCVCVCVLICAFLCVCVFFLCIFSGGVFVFTRVFLLCMFSRVFFVFIGVFFRFVSFFRFL